MSGSVAKNAVAKKSGLSLAKASGDQTVRGQNVRLPYLIALKECKETRRNIFIHRFRFKDRNPRKYFYDKIFVYELDIHFLCRQYML